MSEDAVTIEKDDIDTELVTRLIAAQFPEWAGLPVRPVDVSGWDNRTFRLGDDMSVRLPSAAGYVAAVEKEQRWLPQLAPHLPLPIPVPIGNGVPGQGYPWPWSVNRWLVGETATLDRIDDLTRFAEDLAAFLIALQAVDPTGGPPAGAHSFYRGASLTVYDEETRRAIATLGDRIDAVGATAVWDDALSATWLGEPVWFHGDVAFGNLLVRDGRLAAVIDFGFSGVGDPACDVVIAWTLLSGESRAAFRAALPLDDATWARGRGWAIWKALITLAEYERTDAVKASEARFVIDEVLADHRRIAQRESGRPL